MKILFLSDNFPPESCGGAEIVAYNLAKELRTDGYDVFIITTVREKSEECKMQIDGLSVFKIYSNYHAFWRSWLCLYNPQTVIKAKKIMQDIKPDIVHAHNLHSFLSYHCLKLAKKYSKAVFLTAHDAMLIHYGKIMPKNGNVFYKVSILDQVKEAGKRYNPFRNIIIRYYLRYVNKIFCVSNSLKKLLAINGITNTETIYNGIDVDDWRVDGQKVDEFKKKYDLFGKKIIIFSGRLIEVKGGDRLLKSLAMVKNSFPNFVLLVAGKQWAYTEKMKKMAKNLGIEDKIIFTGFLGEDGLKLSYYASDICVFPSLCFETFGMFNLEAMACKKPVISTCFGGPSEVVIDGATGYLIDPNNVELMTEKIIDLLKNPQKAKQFGEAGYQRVKEKFSLNKQTDETLKWYKRYV